MLFLLEIAQQYWTHIFCIILLIQFNFPLCSKMLFSPVPLLNIWTSLQNLSLSFVLMFILWKFDYTNWKYRLSTVIWDILTIFQAVAGPGLNLKKWLNQTQRGNTCTNIKNNLNTNSWISFSGGFYSFNNCILLLLLFIYLFTCVLFFYLCICFTICLYLFVCDHHLFIIFPLAASIV